MVKPFAGPKLPADTTEVSMVPDAKDTISRVLIIENHIAAKVSEVEPESRIELVCNANSNHLPN